ncbi:MAG TPA: methylated-DNA--[protein]-cysteine S-methyltransferase [Solirubrobacteraceae bacterium]|jgi:methylated-DNA-[protein]-cysteine S-methyltransferase|nr:methylated-DNA--[protein]-cysteine S-methyltransferase [Solirubrobacteraceae bacterium]
MSLHPPDLQPGEAAALAARTAARAADEGAAEVAYAVLDGPAGRLVAAATPRGLLRIAYELDDAGLDAILDEIAARLSPRIVEAPARLDGVRRELDEYFDGRRRDFELALDWRLVRAGFARRVLEATARIPFGATSTYAGVAGAAGSPQAFRAAGNALGSNPIPIVVPCHRVLASGGKLGGYTGGLARKRLLLGIEGVPAGGQLALPADA